ncbi:MAG: molybdenum cofactor guanylyltransferase [Bacteroidales bacterium]
MNISAAIIAGGESQRLNGISKSLIKIDGKYIIDWQLSVISSVFIDYFTISKNEIIPGLLNYQDLYFSIGPISGIHSALVNSKNEYVFAFSSDMPFIQSDIIRKIIEHAKLSKAQVIIPKHKKGIEPLHAIYHKSVLPIIEKFIKNGVYKIRSLFSELNVSYIEVNENAEKVFFNINYPEDILIAEKYAKNG